MPPVTEQDEPLTFKAGTVKTVSYPDVRNIIHAAIAEAQLNAKQWRDNEHELLLLGQLDDARAASLEVERHEACITSLQFVMAKVAVLV